MRLVIRTEERLLARLEERSDYVYRMLGTVDWGVTHGGVVEAGIVERLIDRGALRPVYSNTHDAYGLAPTIDVEASLAERQRTGNKATLVYVA